MALIQEGHGEHSYRVPFWDPVVEGTGKLR